MNTCDYTVIVQIWWQYVNFLTIKGNLILLTIVRTVGTHLLLNCVLFLANLHVYLQLRV